MSTTPVSIPNDPFGAWLRAVWIANEAHRDQVDKSGQPYICHPLRVAWSVGPEDYELKAIAVLHDVLEDSEWTGEDLEAEGIPKRIIDAVTALTHFPGESRDVYYDRVKANPDALKVKLADISDNMSPVRMEALDAETRSRLESKYAKAWFILTGEHFPQ